MNLHYCNRDAFVPSPVPPQSDQSENWSRCKPALLVGIKEPCNNSPAWKPWSERVGNKQKGHTKQRLSSSVITGEQLQLIKKWLCYYIRQSNKKRQLLFTSLASGHCLDLQLTGFWSWNLPSGQTAANSTLRKFAAQANKIEDHGGNLPIQAISTLQHSSNFPLV